MTPSSPHISTMGTGDNSRISVAVFSLGGHAASGPRLVFDQSNCLMSPPSSPPPVGNDPPDSVDTPLFGNGPPFERRWNQPRKTLYSGFCSLARDASTGFTGG